MGLALGLLFVFVLLFIVNAFANMQHRSKRKTPSGYSANRSKPSQSAQFRYHAPSRRNSPKGVKTSIVTASSATVIADSISEKEGVFDNGTSEFSPPESLNTDDINPATGLPMVDGIGSVDIAGNAFGTSHDDFISEVDHDTAEFDSPNSWDDSSSFDSSDM